MSKTNYHELAVLNTARGTPLAAWTPYVGLLSAVADEEAGTVTEITAALGLARKLATFAAPSAGGTMATSADIAFGNATAGGTVTHVGVYDAAAAGNLRYVFAVAAAKTINIGDPVSIPSGQLTITED